LVPPRNSRALADAIGPILSQPRFRQMLGEDGRQRVCERYTWSRVADDITAVYRRLATAPLADVQAAR
jgi:D-inositol-3-phosphate glycosyltransferase